MGIHRVLVLLVQQTVIASTVLEIFSFILYLFMKRKNNEKSLRSKSADNY